MIMECTDNKSNLIKWHLICCICWWFLCLIYNDASDIEKKTKKVKKTTKNTSVLSLKSVKLIVYIHVCFVKKLNYRQNWVNVWIILFH